MLFNCPECELQVSDKALTCPHCGYPFIKASPGSTQKRKKKKRLPNGFGQISEMKGHNLRNKYRAMVTVGKTQEGKPIVKALKPQAYFATYNDAYAALVEYNRNPYDLDDDINMIELYKRWTDEYFPSLKSESSTRTITSAWAYCTSIYNLRAKDLRAKHIKYCMDEGVVKYKGNVHNASPNTKSRIKSMFNLMLDYALEHEIVEKNYSRTFNVSSEVIDGKESAKRGHLPFTEEEMNILWNNVDKKAYVDVILIQCYSGWRPQELGLIRLENVDLENDTFLGGMKTDAGTNRVVPIHPRIKDLIIAKYNQAKELGSDYLINCTDTKTHRSSLFFTYDKYQKRFAKIKNELNLNPLHRAHDGRLHFITMAKKYEVDEYAIKYMVGHKIQDITERVYTKRELDWLKQEIKKIR